MDSSGLSGILGLAFVLIFLGLIIGFRFLNRRRPTFKLREIKAFSRLTRSVGLAVEDGTRLHLTIGSGSITGPESASAFVGLAMLRRVADISSVSDNPPIATAGDASLSILARDTLQSAYRAAESGQFDPDAAILTGVTPFSYAAGTLPLIADGDVSSNLAAGSFGNEAALIMDGSERQECFSLAGTENIPGQSILMATAQEPLIGEELFAGGAYLGAGGMHEASLNAQDVLRYALAAIILIGALLKLVGVF